jgi:hypothetical protein
MAISPNNSFTVGQVLTSAECNNFPFGVVALATNASASQAGTINVVDLTGMSVTFTAIANRNYKVSYHVYGIPTVTNACFSVNLQQGATIKQIGISNAGLSGVGATTSAVYVGTFSAGSVTLKLTGELTSGSTGSITFTAVSVLPWILVVEDIGPA